MFVDKKKEKNFEQKLPSIRKGQLPEDDFEKMVDKFNHLSRDMESIVRPISFNLENTAPDMIRAMNTNEFVIDPFMLTVSNAKLVLDAFYNIAKRELESSDNKYYIAPNSAFVAQDVFVNFIISEFFNVVSTKLCTGMLSKVSKAFALYLLDQLNNKGIAELTCNLRSAINNYSFRYKTCIEKNEDLALTYYTEFNNAMFMSFYAPMIDSISRIIDMDSKALMYMLDDNAVKEIYHILDDESLAYLKANSNENIIIIKNCYKAIIGKDLNDLFLIFPEIVSKSSNILEKYCFDMEVKIRKVEDAASRSKYLDSASRSGSLHLVKRDKED